MTITRSQFARLTNPTCSGCGQAMAFHAPDGGEAGGVTHAEPADGVVCGLLSAGLPRTLQADETPEAHAVFAEMQAA